MNNVILIGTIVDLDEVHEDCLKVAIRRLGEVNVEESI